MGSLPHTDNTKPSQTNGEAKHRAPLKLSGALDKFESFDVTPVIGREYPTANLKEWLEAEDSDALIRDLAITVSQRGVVFFRSQTTLTAPLQKQLAQRLGELSGKPATSKLHIHPISPASDQDTQTPNDPEISHISSVLEKRLFKGGRFAGTKQSGKEGWHSDITFEAIPSDYAILRLTRLPLGGGGDTLWASGYEVYDRISPAYQRFLEGLSATCAQPAFGQAAERGGFQLHAGPRGAPENVGSELTATHPVIRTNPVTGWKSVFAVGHHTQRINEVHPSESDALLKWFVQLIVENHDLQVRHRWVNEHDVAIWDNRSVYHTGTGDYEGVRTGERAVSLGERPYLDAVGSTGRREALERDG